MKTLFLSFFALLATAPYSAARNCKYSNKFTLNHPQAIAGSIEDPSGAVIQEMKMYLLSGKQVIRSVSTDSLGRYDFGMVPVGKYRLRIQDKGDWFCAPAVVCRTSTCNIAPMARANPNKVIIDY